MCVSDSGNEDHDIASTIDERSTPQYWMHGRRLLIHIEQLESPRLGGSWRVCGSDERVFDAADRIAGLESYFDRHVQATHMCMRALVGKEKALGTDYSSILSTVHNLGTLSSVQGKREEESTGTRPHLDN
jgi:hypothetical protein